jgi:hypothetical protein
LPLNNIDDPAVIPVPVITSVGGVAPTVSAVGATDVILGSGLLTVTSAVFDAPPPGGGFTTVICTDPATEAADAGTPIASCVLLMKSGVLFALFTVTTDCVTKFVPVMYSVNPLSPASTLLGLNEVIVGTPLGFAVIVKFRMFTEVPPPGCCVNTVICTVPGFCSSTVEICAVIVLVFTKIVAIASPFHSISEDGVKSFPITVSVNCGCSACTLVGESDSSTGTGLLIY